MGEGREVAGRVGGEGARGGGGRGEMKEGGGRKRRRIGRGREQLALNVLIYSSQLCLSYRIGPRWRRQLVQMGSA